jgi:hypothetical protein
MMPIQKGITVNWPPGASASTRAWPNDVSPDCVVGAEVHVYVYIRNGSLDFGRHTHTPNKTRNMYLGEKKKYNAHKMPRQKETRTKHVRANCSMWTTT